MDDEKIRQVAGGASHKAVASGRVLRYAPGHVAV
jgi:hypothetical protein